MLFLKTAHIDSTQFLGTGSLVLDGTLAFDLSGVTAYGVWDIVSSSLATTYDDDFAVTFNGYDAMETLLGVWSLGNASGVAIFYESTGELSILDVPEPSVLTLLAIGLFGLIACAWRTRRNVGCG